jgi:hypothetical protein
MSWKHCLLRGLYPSPPPAISAQFPPLHL